MGLALDLVELVEIAERLEASKKRLLIEVAKGFLADDWEDDELSENDLYYIQLAEDEYAKGETVSHSEVFKDLV